MEFIINFKENKEIIKHKNKEIYKGFIGNFLLDLVSINTNDIINITKKYEEMDFLRDNVNYSETILRYYDKEYTVLHEAELYENIKKIKKDIVSINKKIVGKYFEMSEKNRYRYGVASRLSKLNLIISFLYDDHIRYKKFIEHYIENHEYHDIEFIHFLSNNEYFRAPYVCHLNDEDNPLDYKSLYEIFKNNYKVGTDIYKYEFEYLIEICDITIYYIVKNDYSINKCENCGKYFIPFLRSDTLYCDRISPQDNNKTCKEYGSQEAYKRNLEENEAQGLSRKIYMQIQMAAKRNKNISKYAQAFENFKIQSKRWKNDVKSGNKTEAEFIEWLNEMKRTGGIHNGNDNEA